LASAPSNPSILIVEDDSIIAWHLESMVSRLGFNVCALVASEEEAVSAAAKHRPTLVLMDVRLARGGDGVRAMEAIRSDLPVPVIFCTAHADDAGFRDRTATLDRSAVLSKPVREDLLKSAIGDLIGLPA
jgi:two-component system, response regulator PdtaR